MGTVIKDKTFVCTVVGCGKEFSSSRQLNRHAIVHSEKRPYVCSYGNCGKAFKVKHHLSRHIKTHRQTSDADNIGELEGVSSPSTSDSGSLSSTCRRTIKKYPCSECDKVFKSKFERNVHIATHTGAKPFKCSICSKDFALKNRLKRHEAMHSKEYKCTFDECPFVAKLWSHMRKHVAENHARRCDKCGKEFASTYNLKIHTVTVHESIKEFKCSSEGCNRTYARQSSLKQHYDAKHSNTLFSCPIDGCDKTFMHSKSLREHESTHTSPRVGSPVEDCTKNTTSSKPLEEREIRSKLPEDLPCKNRSSIPMAAVLSGFTEIEGDSETIKHSDIYDTLVSA